MKKLFGCFGLVAVAIVLFLVAPSKQPIIETTVSLKSIEKIGKLCLIKVFDTYIITNKVNGIQGVFIAPCDALLTLEFSDIQISRSNNCFSVSFPPIEVSQPRVDRSDEFKTWEVSKDLSSMFDSSDPLRQAAFSDAEKRIQLEAISNERYLQSAKDRATNIVATLIRNGVETEGPIEFIWNWKTTATK